MDVDINGLIIYIARADENAPPGPVDPHLGLDHFGLRVDNMDAAVAQLKERGAEFASEPRDLRPGLRIAFVRTRGRRAYRIAGMDLTPWESRYLLVPPGSFKFSYWSGAITPCNVILRSLRRRI